MVFINITGSKMHLHAGEWLVLAMMAAMVLYSLWESDKSKVAVLAGRKTKLAMYRETILFLWVPTSALMILLTLDIVSAQRLGLGWQNSWGNWAGVLLVVASVAYVIWHARSIQPGTPQYQQLFDAMQTHSWLMPSNKRELYWFTGGVSMSAGICEELLFRGFFLAVFADLMGVWVSLLLGSFLFGLCHLYQGWANVLRTGVIGLVLGIIYVLTESLWVVISLHALMDIFGGVLGYVVHKYGRCESELAMG